MEMSDLDQKVFTISALEQGNASKLYNILRQAVLEDLPALHEQRKQQMLQDIGKDLLEMLQERLRVSQFDSTELDDAQDKAQKELKGLQMELRKREGQMDSLQESIYQKVQSILSSRLFEIGAAPGEAERAQLIEAMNNELSQMLQSEAKNYLGLNNFSAAGLGNIAQEIDSKMKSIEAFRNIGVTISSAITFAWLIPGGGVIGNLGQGASGAAAQGAAAALASSQGKNGTGVLGTILGGIGTAFRSINPFEHIGNAIAANRKKNALQNMVNEKAGSITNAFLVSLESPFQAEVLQPIQEQLAEKRRQLSAFQDQGMRAIEDFRRQKSQTEQEIAQLQSLLS